MKHWALLLFLTLGMHGIYTAEEARVVDVQHGLVTMECERGVYQIEEHEAWRVGDRAEAIVRNGRIVEVRWMK